MKRFLKGFVYAVHGIIKAVRQERNLRVHIVTGIIVLLLSGFYAFSPLEYMLLIILISGVISLEMVNSAIERSVDKPSERHYYSAGDAKDMAAGAVLVFSVASAACGFIMFWDTEVFAEIGRYALQNPVLSLIFALVFALLYVWAFKPRKEDI